LLYQQLDHPLVLLLYSLYEGRVSFLYRIGKDRIRVEKKKRGGEKKKRKTVRETWVRHDRRSSVDTSYELHCCCYGYHY